MKRAEQLPRQFREWLKKIAEAEHPRRHGQGTYLERRLGIDANYAGRILSEDRAGNVGIGTIGRIADRLDTSGARVLNMVERGELPPDV